MTIACALCVGANPEPYLAATLASIAPVVDILVVNDNSGVPDSINIGTIRQSAFGRDGRARIFAHSFAGFDRMRNDAFGDLCSIAAPDWVLFLDADEVHGSQLRDIAQGLLPRLPPHIAQLDGYTYHFWGTFDWLSDIARRTIFFRFDRALRWRNAVHEKLVGLRGAAAVLPYTYHHYGNVLPPALLASKYLRYYAFGNAVPRPPDEERATIDMYLQRATAVRPYRSTHPAAAEATLARIRNENAGLFTAIDSGLRARRGPGARLRGALAGTRETIRSRLRYLEHPTFYREAPTAR